ncbi:MAG: type III pantothenate kinase [Wenzhouxiangellaceae bacterium]
MSFITAPLDRAGARWFRIETGRPELPVAPSYAGWGVDRWLAVQPVWSALKRGFCLVDCGSALTIDLVDDHGRHRGGWILPGLETARRGLLAVAPVLRRDPPAEPATPEPANDTAMAIENGLLLQQVGAIRLALEQAARLDGLGPATELVLTGGAAAPLQCALDSARLEPDLVLKGLAIAAQRMELQ